MGASARGDRSAARWTPGGAALPAGAEAGAVCDAAAGDSAPWRTVGVFSRRLARTPHLPALVGAQRIARFPPAARARDLDAVVGWGRKRRHERARAYAARHGLPYWCAEDGFLRSVGLGVSGAAPLSIVLDDRGIYYDATRPSRLEALLAADGPVCDTAGAERARACIDAIVDAGLSKYNHSPPGPVRLPGRRPRVLVVDQTRGDLSVRLGLADAATFDAMLRAARDENPGADLLVKTHPDVVAGKKRGYLARVAEPGVHVVAEPINPIRLVQQVDRVYVVTSQLGFEAVMAGIPVTCFGAPFYAGWGLTDDRAAIPRRGRSRSVEEVFFAAYIAYARYVDPDTGCPCDIERVIDHLALQRRMFERNRGRWVCFGFRPWKRGYVRAYLRSPGGSVAFARDAEHAESLGVGPDAHLLVWGQRAGVDVERLARRLGRPIARMEDGFLRSVGLGSDLEVPASLVVDRAGIYYDPTRPSDLERILQTAEFSPDELARAARLRERIVAAGVSKYNVGRPVAWRPPPGRRVVLVPGQVEDDASIRLGCRDIRTNLDLLAAVRRVAPDAFLLYKPHPDVLSGNRTGGAARDAAHAWCDRIEEEASLAQCLEMADEVHTMTSLVGFEALLRGLRVVTYGQPFYAGWGLTEDRHPVARRTRRLSLDELVAGVLLRYPIYLNRATGQFTTPEVVMDQLVAERERRADARTVKVSWPRRQLRKLAAATRGVLHAP